MALKYEASGSSLRQAPCTPLIECCCPEPSHLQLRSPLRGESQHNDRKRYAPPIIGWRIRVGRTHASSARTCFHPAYRTLIPRSSSPHLTRDSTIYYPRHRSRFPVFAVRYGMLRYMHVQHARETLDLRHHGHRGRRIAATRRYQGGHFKYRRGRLFLPGCSSTYRSRTGSMSPPPSCWSPTVSRIQPSFRQRNLHPHPYRRPLPLHPSKYQQYPSNSHVRHALTSHPLNLSEIWIPQPSPSRPNARKPSPRSNQHWLRRTIAHTRATPKRSRGR